MVPGPADGQVTSDRQLGGELCQPECEIIRRYTYDGDPAVVYNKMKARFAAAGWTPAHYNCECEAEDSATGAQGRTGVWCKDDLGAIITVLTTGPRDMDYRVSADLPVMADGRPHVC